MERYGAPRRGSCSALGLRFARALRLRVASALACTAALAKPFGTRAAPPARPPAWAVGLANSCPHFGQRIMSPLVVAERGVGLVKVAVNRPPHGGDL